MFYLTFDLAYQLLLLLINQLVSYIDVLPMQMSNVLLHQCNYTIISSKHRIDTSESSSVIHILTFDLKNLSFYSKKWN